MIQLYFISSTSCIDVRDPFYSIHAQIYLNRQWMGSVLIEEMGPLPTHRDIERRKTELAANATLAWKEDLLMQCLL